MAEWLRWGWFGKVKDFGVSVFRLRLRRAVFR